MDGNKPPWLVDISARRLVNKLILWRGRVRVVSYPRSGRTWLRVMLHDLAIDPRFHHAGAQRKLQLGPDAICERIPKFTDKRVLFLMRDPRDTIVSHFHHIVRLKAWDGDIAGFVRGASTGFERLLEFHLGWLEAQGRFRDFAVVRYEDLRQDAESELRRIVNFMGCGKPGSEELARVAAGNAFGEMHRREKSGELHAKFGDRFSAAADDPNLMIVRRGVIGSHADELALAERKFCEELMSRCNYQERVDELVARAARGRQAGPTEGAV